jgi:exosome complex RNA-binding protein Rrp4
MLSSLLAGSATVTNELLQVIRAREPLHLSTGDPVLGRIVAIRSGQWGVDIGAPRLASLDLSAINLPFQGVRSAADTRNMRAFLREGDVVFAEVERGALNPSASAISGSARPVRLMTRDNRYGKLQHGCLLHVPPELTDKDATMAVTLPADPVPREAQIQVTVGVNGAVWVSAPRTGSSQFASLRQAGAARRSAAQTPSASRASAAVGVDTATDSASSVADTASDVLTAAQRRNSLRAINAVHVLVAARRAVTARAVAELFGRAFDSERRAIGQQSEAPSHPAPSIAHLTAKLQDAEALERAARLFFGR